MLDLVLASDGITGNDPFDINPGSIRVVSYPLELCFWITGLWCSSEASQGVTKANTRVRPSITITIFLIILITP